MPPFETIDFDDLAPHKKIYFVSDFHLGAPSYKESKKREQKIVHWLEHVKSDASAIFFVGDIFDFWFEYKHTIPKGFIRFQGKLTQLVDEGVNLFFFSGNHDLWYRNYFKEELGITIYHSPIRLKVENDLFLVGHGDGLGKGDRLYKFLKRLFTSRVSIWMFRWLHPDFGVALAHFWSKKSRAKNGYKDDVFLNEQERLFLFCKEIETQLHHDYYIFGHRHMHLEMKVSDVSTYFNLGDWINGATYLAYDGQNAALHHFDH